MSNTGRVDAQTKARQGTTTCKTRERGCGHHALRVCTHHGEWPAVVGAHPRPPVFRDALEERGGGGAEKFGSQDAILCAFWPLLV